MPVPASPDSGIAQHSAFAGALDNILGTSRSSSVMSHASVWLERFACFDQCFEAGEGPRAPNGYGGGASVVFPPKGLVCGKPDRHTFLDEVYRDTGDPSWRGQGEGV